MIPTKENLRRLFPIAKNARYDAVLKRMPEGPIVGAEVGVLAGVMSSALLEREDLFLYMIDIKDRLLGPIRRKPKFERSKFILANSLDAAKMFEDNFFDFVFLDNDHSYAHVMAEIPLWMPKVKPGGWLCGHDYEKPLTPKVGVKTAVDEVFPDAEKDFDSTWFVRKGY